LNDRLAFGGEVPSNASQEGCAFASREPLDRMERVCRKVRSSIDFFGSSGIERGLQLRTVRGIYTVKARASRFSQFRANDGPSG
jgi:hypothetical protein